MAAETGDIWSRVGDGSIGAGITLIGAVAAALIGRKSPLAAIVNEQLKLLIESQREEIKSLRAELKEVREELDAVKDELEAERRVRWFGL